MTKKTELLNLLLEALKPIDFKSVDLLERFTYDRQDLPVCIIKESSTEINTTSSQCWEHICDLSISIIDGNPNYDLSQDVLEGIKNIPRDSFLFSFKSATLESKFEDVPYHQIVLNLEVKYYTQEYQL